MPYIPLEDRVQYQEALTEISMLIPKDRTKRCGHMNYVISLLIEKVYGKEMRYADHNEVVGVLTCAKNELYRVKTGPYEDLAIAKNGDLSVLPPEGDENE
jgi:hypothetical protein